jgi:LasA protease
MHTSLARRCLIVASAGLLVLLSPAASQAGPTSSAGQSLETVVTGELLDRAEGISQFVGHTADQTRVTVTKRSGKTWAFGTAILLAPHKEGAYPQGWLFLAKRSAQGWQVAFEDAATFDTLARNAPMLGSRERANLTSSGDASTTANGDYRTGMRLPYGVGQSWYMGGGPHGWAGTDFPYSSVDLSGGDQVVVAARGGTAYTMCQGWIRVIHDRGYATDYYHLWSNINVNGAGVGEGAYLGYTGTDVTCGGSASGRHVHFALRQNNAYVGIMYHIIGKWIPWNGSSAYGGYALHGSAQVNVGGALYNYGVLGFTQGIIDTNGGGTVNKRSGPGTGYAIVGSVADGTTVSVACSANGTTHSGRWGTTSLWNRLTDGTWVTDAYMATGINGPLNGWC